MSADRAAAFVEAAHCYAALGWALIHAEGKEPKTKAWQETQPDVPELAAGKWAHWGGHYNLGVVCGPSGLAIVDVDRDDADAAFLRLIGTSEMPLTPAVRTGRGRLQIYFADPGGLTKTVRDGFELRVGPHQCIAPPSEHPETGAPYVWLPGLEPWTVPLQPLPHVLVEFFQADAQERRNGAAPPAKTTPIRALPSTPKRPANPLPAPPHRPHVLDLRTRNERPKLQPDAQHQQPLRLRQPHGRLNKAGALECALPWTPCGRATPSHTRPAPARSRWGRPATMREGRPPGLVPGGGLVSDKLP